MTNLAELLQDKGVELSDEVRASLEAEQTKRREEHEELERLRRDSRKSKIDDRIEELKKLGLEDHPGLLKTIRSIYLSDDEGPALVLSEEDGGKTKLTATEVVDKVIEAFPTKDGVIHLGEQQVQVDGGDKDKPPVDAEGENKSADERAADAREFLGIK